MVTLAESVPNPLRVPPLRDMFEARKRVFVDLFKWDVPVLEGRYELDQYDDEHAAYLIVACGDGAHAGSTRLLKTTRPHILDTLFPELCAAAPPCGPEVLEITRGSHASAPPRGATFRIESEPQSARGCGGGKFRDVERCGLDLRGTAPGSLPALFHHQPRICTWPRQAPRSARSTPRVGARIF